MVAGTLAAAGPGLPFAVVGPFNLSAWGEVATALTTTAGSLSASVASGTGIAAGTAVNSALVPPGTVWGAFSGTTGTLAVPPVSQYGVVNTADKVVRGVFVTAGLVGAAVSGPGIPAGTTVASVVAAVGATSGTITLSAQPTIASPLESMTPLLFLPTANAILASGTDSTATFTGPGSAAQYVGTLQIERSFDGGHTWLPYSFPGSLGSQARINTGLPFSQVFAEPERGVLWRLNCIAYTSGTIRYRLSTTGAAATSGGAMGVI